MVAKAIIDSGKVGLEQHKSEKSTGTSRCFALDQIGKVLISQLKGYVSDEGVSLPFMPASAILCSLFSHKNRLWRLCTIPFDHVQTIGWND